jgi:hypothetical protein
VECAQPGRVENRRHLTAQELPWLDYARGHDSPTGVGNEDRHGAGFQEPAGHELGPWLASQPQRERADVYQHPREREVREAHLVQCRPHAAAGAFIRRWWRAAK